jgi:protein-S-isoprenylcysteine O-methyltransferase Ste14
MNNNLLPNRVAVYLTVLAGIITAVLPTLADMDWKSTAGVMSGLGAIVVAAVTFLIGWQRHEARQAIQSTLSDDPAFPVLEDEVQSAEVVVG